jgi:hypothetical protein
MGTYASILALQLARIARTSRADQLIGRDDIHELFIGIRHKKDRDEAMLRGRIEDAITKMVKVNILLPSSEDPDSFSISPAILAVMSGQMVDELSSEFERLRRDSDGGLTEGSVGVDLDADDDDAEESVGAEDGASDDYYRWRDSTAPSALAVPDAGHQLGRLRRLSRHRVQSHGNSSDRIFGCGQILATRCPVRGVPVSAAPQLQRLQRQIERSCPTVESAQCRQVHPRHGRRCPKPR